MSDKKVIKILMLSDAPTTTTGYATITRKVLNALSKEGFECHCLAHNYYGQTLIPGTSFEDGETIDFYLHGTGAAKYSMDKIQKIIHEKNIDVFGILLDTFMAFEAGYMGVDTSPAKTFFYYPTDGGGGLPKGCEAILKKVMLPIAMARYGKDQIKKCYDIDSEYIPHGVDTKTFFPLSSEERDKLRANWQLTDKFVVGTVARNQSRKMLDRTLKAFRLFADKVPEAILLMHCDPSDPASAIDLRNLINRFKLNNRVIFTGTTFFDPFSYTRMNEVYNLMDVFLLSTSGEGFGIPTIEAMACGVPQVATDYTSSRELILEDGQSGELVKLAGESEFIPTPHTDEILDGSITGSWDVERGMMSVYDGADILLALYNDVELREKYSRVGLAKVKKLYDWNVIIPKWVSTIKRLIDG